MRAWAAEMKDAPPLPLPPVASNSLGNAPPPSLPHPPRYGHAGLPFFGFFMIPPPPLVFLSSGASFYGEMTQICVPPIVIKARVTPPLLCFPDILLFLFPSTESWAAFHVRGEGSYIAVSSSLFNLCSPHLSTFFRATRKGFPPFAFIN